MWNPLSRSGAPAHEGLTLDQMATLAIEHWRLQTALDPASTPAPARHALRQITDLLKAAGIEVQTLEGVAYDPGLRAEVVDRVVDAAAAAAGHDVIIETVSPLVLCHGQVVRAAQVVVGTAG